MDMRRISVTSAWWRIAGLLILLLAIVGIVGQTMRLGRTIASLEMELEAALTKRDDAIAGMVTYVDAFVKCDALAAADANVGYTKELEAIVQRQHDEITRLTARMVDAERHVGIIRVPTEPAVRLKTTQSGRWRRQQLDGASGKEQ